MRKKSKQNKVVNVELSTAEYAVIQDFATEMNCRKGEILSRLAFDRIMDLEKQRKLGLGDKNAK